MILNNITEMLFSSDFLYWRLLFSCILLTVILLVFKFSETVIIKSGIYFFAGFLILNFVHSFYSETYWYYILHWFLSSISFFVFWYLTVFICERFGRPYSGDGAMVMLLPGYFLFAAICGSVIIKSFMALIQRF